MDNQVYYSVFKFVLLVFLVPCSWSQNIAPTLSATGNQPYCPQSQIHIVTDFDIEDPDDEGIEALYIQISTGYQQGEDMLLLLGTHPDIATSWNSVEGKLTLTGTSSSQVSYINLVAAVKDVVFQSSSAQPNDKSFSITIGDANYLPLTGHYYEYVSDYGITWSDAKTKAEARTYFGLQGYLATILYPEEAQLAGEQASGAGWLGGTDEENEGEWKWVTGPDAGTVFWNGLANGSTPNYANWNYNEPNNVNGGEDYLHITDPSIGIPGAWNDLREFGEPPGPYYPKGYIVEYGGMPGDPVVSISASTNLYALTVVSPLSSVLTYSECDNLNDGDDYNGFTDFDLTNKETALLNGNNPDNFYFEYFLDANYSNAIPNPSSFINTVAGGQTIYVKIINTKMSSCLTETSFNIVVSKPPLAKPSIDFKNCDADLISDGFTEFNLSEITPYITSESNVTISYHPTYNDAETSNNTITSSINNQTNNPVYARVENTRGCYRISIITLQVSTTAFPSGYFEALNTCDDDGVFDGLHEFDLSQTEGALKSQFPAAQNLSISYYERAEDAQLEQNRIAQPTKYQNSIAYFQDVFVRVESSDNGMCYGIAPVLRLTVYGEPEFEIDEFQTYCSEGEPVVVSAFNVDASNTYRWFNSSGEVISNMPSAEIVSGGEYSVVARSSYGCDSDPVYFTVQESAKAVIGFDDVSIVDATENNSISIDNVNNNLGIGDYEFAVDDSNYQDSPVFMRLNPGAHTVYVRDKNGCGVTSVDVFILGFPKFFTPNNDGQNDFWQIEGLGTNFTPQSTVNIYDRYGKLLKQFKANDFWDGTFKGEFLPNSDYWFVAELIKTSGGTKIYRGHFSLKR
ncbi:T9SS type B sorting domain-containing protein [Flavobacteriaceae bacterium GSB9]|nr:T9SS type B sorting domain-containing protein [Flavobacteriaceae bacterium GSB9]